MEDKVDLCIWCRHRQRTEAVAEALLAAHNIELLLILFLGYIHASDVRIQGFLIPAPIRSVMTANPHQPTRKLASPPLKVVHRLLWLDLL